MSNTIRFTAYGDVQPAHRPRAFKVGKGVRMHNDKRHDNWMDSVAAQALVHRPARLLEGPVRLCVDVYIIKPKSVKREYPTVKPDATNYAKAVEDALNKLIWVDDAQVVDQRCRKFYGNPSRAEITVEEINGSLQL